MKINDLFLLVSVACAATCSASLKALNTLPEPAFYRELVQKIRPSGTYILPHPSGDVTIQYQFEWSAPLYKEPIISDSTIEEGQEKLVFRNFFDKIFVKDGSFLQVGQDRLQVSCIFVSGQDNRKIGLDTPLLPELLLKVYIVTDDFACEGPINKGFPGNGGKEELWASYLFFKIKDPTIMLPVDPSLRYRWNDYQVVLSDAGLQGVKQ